LYTSIIFAKDGHIPSPLIMLTSTALHHVLWSGKRTTVCIRNLPCKN
jgi:hypothetical protein